MLVVILSACSQPAPNEESSEPADQGTQESQADESEEASAEAVELSYLGWSDEESYLTKVFDEFTSMNPNITINASFSAGDDYYPKILTMLSSGAADFDVFSVNGVGLLSTYSDLAGLYDLTEYIERDAIDTVIYGPSMNDMIMDGKHLVLPYRSSCFGLFYNKDIFDEAGEPYPENITWDEYAEIAARLTNGEGETKIWGGFIPDWMRAPITTIQEGSNLVDDDLSPISGWLERLNLWYNIDQSHMSFAEMKSTKVDWIKFFEGGTVAMLPNGEWTISLLNADAAAGNHDINWDVAPLPVINEGDALISPGGLSTYMGIYANSENPDAAFELIKFVSGEEAAMLLAGDGILPAFVSESVKTTFVDSSGVSGAGALLSAETYLESLNIPEMSAINQAYDEEKELYLTGQQSIEDFETNFSEKRATAFEG